MRRTGPEVEVEGDPPFTPQLATTMQMRRAALDGEDHAQSDESEPSDWSVEDDEEDGF